MIWVLASELAQDVWCPSCVSRVVNEETELRLVGDFPVVSDSASSFQCSDAVGYGRQTRAFSL